jgi:Tfp pilus assembly protein PilZ
MLKQYDQTISKLIKLMLNLNDAQKKALLEKGQQLFRTETRAPREKCQIPVKYSTFDRTYSDNIMNLSHSGAFIQTRRPIFIGEEILLQFSIEGLQDPVNIRGKVVHASLEGIGIEFKNTSQHISDFIKKVILEKENTNRHA